MPIAKTKKELLEAIETELILHIFGQTFRESGHFLRELKAGGRRLSTQLDRMKLIGHTNHIG